MEIAQEKPEGFRESDRSEKRHAKWSDRKPYRKRDGRKKDSVKPLRWEKKSGKKDKKKKSW